MVDTLVNLLLKFMKKFLLICFALVLLGPTLYAQQNVVLKVESYQLANGLTVFLNPDTTANRVFGAVMVNAGAKHEDPKATGMAHYLEHLLFKGTENFGTADFEKEKPHLDSINVLYEKLAQAQSDDSRESIQLLINEQAVKASEYGLPNEFDKMLKSIGGTGVNAFTSMEMTFYHNSFPGHEVYKWLDLYAERFQNPIFRSFQSELEVVYEEKNRAMDDFQRKIGEEMQQRIFPNIPYGQWSVLGKVEHLKSPSLIRMYQFFEENYKAGNMALILSGNFDPVLVKPAIEETFSQLPAGTVEKLTLDQPTPFEGAEVAKKRMTPIKASFVGYHTVGNSHPDRVALDVVEYLLFNNAETGYLNQLMTNDQMTYSGIIPMTFNDAGGLVVFYVPKIVGQSLGKAERLVEEQLDKLREGAFSDVMLAAAKNELSQFFSGNLENVTERGIMIGRAFNQGKTWEEFLRYPERLDQVSREDVLRVAKQYLGEDRLKVISRTGFQKGTKLDKPNYKPIVTEQKEESDYFEAYQKIPSLPFQPRFVDFQQDVTQIEMTGGHQLLVATNPINELFELQIKFKKGRLSNPELITATSLMNYLGAGEHDLNQLKEAFAALGLAYSIGVDMNHTNISLSGREDQLAEGLALLNGLLTTPKFDEKSKEVYLNNTIAERELDKESPGLLGRAVYDYGIFGNKSVHLSRKSEAELKAMNLDALVAAFKEVCSQYAAEIWYTGAKPANEVQNLLTQNLNLSSMGKAIPAEYLEGKKYEENTIFFVNDKKAIQSQVYFHIEGETFDPNKYAEWLAFNQYFGGGFSGLVLQEIREYRSLAYSAAGVYQIPTQSGKEGRLIGYIGCQADKTSEAIPVMLDLLKNLPEKPERIEALRNTMQLSTVTNFPEFRDLPSRVSLYQERGFTEDPNQKAYEAYPRLTMEDIKAFHADNIAGKPYMITIYGDRKRIDLDALKAYGKVIELEVEDVMRF